MFKKSLTLVFTVLALVIGSAFTTQMVLSSQLPSAYDPGVKLQDAFKTSEHPLLIEFYSDECRSCRAVTPLIHDVYKERFQDKLTLVMLDINDPEVSGVMQLFGVEAIPALYVFDAKNMKKTTIELEDLSSAGRLSQALGEAVTEARERALKKTSAPAS